MSGIKGIDELALRLAVVLAKQQPRCDNTIAELPSVSAAIATDLVPIFRNGVTYGCPISGFPSGGSSSSIYFNVMSFGATGNGTTDDTAAVQSAITAAQTAGGGVVFFPPGIYLRSAAWTVGHNGISFLGCGAGASVILSGGASVSPTVFAFGSGVSYCWVQDLGFTGNSIAPSGPPPNAPTVISFNSGVKVGVYNCYFQNSLGDCVDFLGCTDGEVAFCRFVGTGYRGAGDSNALQTPAVYSDLASVAIRVHHNYLENCQYIGIQHLGTDCEASFNEIKTPGACGIRIHDGSTGRVSGTRVIGNVIYLSTRFSSGAGSGGGTGIYADSSDNLVVAGNIVHNTDADGMAFAGCNHCVVVQNVIYNCCQAAGDCGIQFNPQSGNPGGNQGMVFSNNTIYDSQGSPTMQNGIRVLGPGSGGAFGAVISGNSLYGFTGTVSAQPQHGLAMTDSVLDDDSNVIRSTAGAWLDFQHLGASVTVNAGVTATNVNTPAGSVLYSTTVEEGEMGLQRGFKFTAYGPTTGTDTFKLYCSYGGTLGNIFTDSARTSVNNASWLLEVWFFGAANNNVQHFVARLTYNGALVAVQQGNLAVDSTQAQPFALQVTTTGATTTVCQSAVFKRE